MIHFHGSRKIYTFHSSNPIDLFTQTKTRNIMTWQMQNKLRETVCIFFLHKHASLKKYMHFLRPKYCMSPERSVIGCAFSTLEVNFISRDFKSRSVFSVPIMIGIHDLTVYAITAEGGLCARHMTWKFVKMFHISSRRY